MVSMVSMVSTFLLVVEFAECSVEEECVEYTRHDLLDLSTLDRQLKHLQKYNKPII